MVSPLYGPLSQSPSQSRALNEASTQRRDVAPGRAAPSASALSREGVIRTPQDAINVLRIRVQQQLEQHMGRLQGDGNATQRNLSQAFQPPSAADVAGTVLGFVTQRLEQEAAGGADSERLALLLEQARSGIEKGFGEAREQIEALGLMTGQLADDINDGFGRIQDGLAQLMERFLKTQPDDPDKP